MKAQFAKNYPEESLDAHSTPSVKLCSVIHQQKVNEHIKHVPIQLRLSKHQYCAMIETRSSKPLRGEILIFSQLCWDDTPEMDINSVQFSRDWLNRISTVLRNAYAWCSMCHLQVLKTCDSKIAEYTFPYLHSELGLRHVMATEFIAADKKRWGAISQLHAKGWTLGGSIHYYSQGPRFQKLFLHLVTPKEKEKDLRKALARERPKAPHSQKTRIGALGVSTTSNG